MKGMHFIPTRAASDGAQFLHVAQKLIKRVWGSLVRPYKIVPRALRAVFELVPSQLHDRLRYGDELGAGCRGALQHHPRVLPLVRRRRVVSPIVPRPLVRARLALFSEVVPRHRADEVEAAHERRRRRRRLAHQHERLLARVGRRRRAGVPVVPLPLRPVAVCVQRQLVDDALGAADEGGARGARLLQDGARLLERVGRRRVVAAVVPRAVHRRVVVGCSVLVQLELTHEGGARDEARALGGGEGEEADRLLVRLRDLTKAKPLLPRRV
mmetsp:Transcript_9182/g.22096  ORF Transcript_9182/g.22096 Transcript_9182/m.22096 type:complete len:269 (+) Transcript_9182:250-1056(+)